MPTKRKARPPRARSTGRQIALTLSIVPMIGGGLLMLGSLMDITVRGTPGQQALAGLLLVLLGFAVANAAQGQMDLAAGWAMLMLGTGAWLLLPSGARLAALLPAGIGAFLLGRVFVTRLSASGRAARGR